MLLHASKVLLAMCLLYVGHGLAMDKIAASGQQPSNSHSSGSGSGSSKKIIVICGDETYNLETIDAAFDRGFKELQDSWQTGKPTENLIIFHPETDDVVPSDPPYFGISILHPSNNNQRGIVIFSVSGHVIKVVNQIKIVHSMGEPRVQYRYEHCTTKLVEEENFQKRPPAVEQRMRGEGFQKPPSAVKDKLGGAGFQKLPLVVQQKMRGEGFQKPPLVIKQKMRGEGFQKRPYTVKQRMGGEGFQIPPLAVKHKLGGEGFQKPPSAVKNKLGGEGFQKIPLAVQQKMRGEGFQGQSSGSKRRLD